MLDEIVKSLLAKMAEQVAADLSPGQQEVISMKMSRFNFGDETRWALGLVIVSKDKKDRDDWAKMLNEQGDWESYHIFEDFEFD